MYFILEKSIYIKERENTKQKLLDLITVKQTDRYLWSSVRDDNLKFCTYSIDSRKLHLYVFLS